MNQVTIGNLILELDRNGVVLTIKVIDRGDANTPSSTKDALTMSTEMAMELTDALSYLLKRIK